MEFYLTAIILGLCLSSMALGIFITMKIFHIPDITTDGSYTLGAVVTALLLTAHWPVMFIIPVVMLAGAIAGTFTGIIHTRLKIDALLAGILVMTGLYSINLSILGRSNVPLLNVATVFAAVHIFNNAIYNDAFTGLIFIAVISISVGYVLKTDFGIAMRATGNSSSMTRALGINDNRMKIIGLAIANSLTALSGFLVAQYQNFTDINMGIGIVITGLGSVLIGDALIRWWGLQSIAAQLAVVLGGSIIFQLVLAFTLSIGIDPNLLKLVTAVFVIYCQYSGAKEERRTMIELQHVHKVYSRGKVNEVNALNDVSLTIQKEEFVVVVGANGSGKTTLLNVIAGAEFCSEGKVLVKGADVTKLPEYARSRWIARVFQNPLMGTASDLSVIDNFRLAALRTGKRNLIVGVNDAFKNKVREKIATLGLGLENKVEQPMGTLSGGQRQALTLLMSVMADTDILLLDEPTAALDPRSANIVLQTADILIKTYRLTAVLITHNLKEAHQYGSRLIQMNEGKILKDLNSVEKARLQLQDIFGWFA